MNTVDSWPLVIDVPASLEPNDYSGQSNVQRSFVVNAGHAPAVAVALGIVVALESGAGNSLYTPKETHEKALERVDNC